jgi:spoIIIJ-associated protein
VEGVEAEGRTVNEATDKALAELGLRRDQVSVEVLSEGRPRLLGFGGEPARVMVTPAAQAAPPAATATAPRAPVRARAAARPRVEEAVVEAEDEDYGEEGEEGEEEEQELPAALRRTEGPVKAASAEEIEAGVSVLQELLRLMSVEAEVTSRDPETAGDGIGMIEAVFDVEGDDLGILIGRRGQTLASLQYVLNLIVAKKVKHRVSLGVDVDSYRRRREQALVTLARRMAERVRGTGRSVTLEPMPPNERRIVHLALSEDAAVMTVSIGEGDARKVAITPAR